MVTQCLEILPFACLPYLVQYARRALNRHVRIPTVVVILTGCVDNNISVLYRLIFILNGTQNRLSSLDNRL